MRKWTRIAALLLATLLVAGLASGCGEDPEMTFSAALVGVPASYDPALAVSQSEQIAAVHLYENLMRLQNGDSGTEVVGAVAQSWECADNLDGTETYTFHLRGDAKWSDGRTVQAGDFVYAWQHLVDPATESPNAALLDMVAGYDKARGGDLDALAVRAVNDTTLEVALSCRCPYFLRSICTVAATMPRRADLAGSKSVVGNGPYCWGDDTDGVLTLHVSEHYYDTRRLGPDTLKLYFCATSEQAETLFNDGTVDFAGNVDDEALAADEGWTKEALPQTTVLVVNQMTQQLGGGGIRQAMSLAIDRVSLAQLPGGGLRTPAEGLIPYGITSSDGLVFREVEGPRIDNTDYEKNCADALAQLQNRPMEAIRDVVILFEMSGINAQIAGQIQSNWQKQLNLSVKTQGLSPEEMALKLQRGEFNVALISVEGDRSDASAFLNTWRTGSPDNVVLFGSSAYDMLMRVAAASSSNEARDAYLADAERLLLEQGNVIPLYSDVRAYRLRTGFAGLLSDGLGVFCFGGVRQVAN
ncbi:MAG: peptide ABC transporter substrate-binding protein [Oscillospiraceae bacterium]|nr:peptide ABC transporter substrate-binding protein [Oscillospiraceae bacterium]